MNGKKSRLEWTIVLVRLQCTLPREKLYYTFEYFFMTAKL
jgi:hypothetical protein